MKRLVAPKRTLVASIENCATVIRLLPVMAAEELGIVLHH